MDAENALCCSVTSKRRAPTPSNDEVVAFPCSSISMLEMRVGFTMFRVSNPRTIAGAAFSWWWSRPVRSEVRRKTTDSVNLMQREFFSEWRTILSIDHVLPDLQCVLGWAKIRHDRFQCTSGLQELWSGSQQTDTCVTVYCDS